MQRANYILYFALSRGTIEAEQDFDKRGVSICMII